ncbi:MAG: GNAT family N-acetyltransferase [Chloroflexaceae bacterium]|jgi:RimJ/RimL family protein N-acetyltransferase|nr:GNAT family N-acetyltransferase [Chloroflexaceae bacterium]
MTHNLTLREVTEADLPLFFAFQLDPEANHMAAFTADDPTNREAFDAHWRRIRAMPTVINRTIVVDGQVVGSVASYEDEGRPEVTYWLGRAFWGQGVASAALRLFLAEVNQQRPIYARVASDNPGSRRVLEKCGFRVIGQERSYANARHTEIDELILELI